MGQPVVVGQEHVAAGRDGGCQVDGVRGLHPVPPSRRPWYERYLATAWGALSGEAFATAWEEGRASPTDQTVGFALAG